jgi:hypothetical protein
MERVRMVCVLRGDIGIAQYVRSCIERCVDKDLEKFPSASIFMRPDQTVYKMQEIGNETIYTALTRTIGGERCWILKSIGNVPVGMGGFYAFLVDITVQPGQQGCEARSVVISADSVYGGNVRQSSPAHG